MTISFYCKINDTKFLYTLLSAIGNQSKLELDCREAGILFTTNDQNIMQSSGYLKSSQAVEYNIAQPQKYLLDSKILKQLFNVFPEYSTNTLELYHDDNNSDSILIRLFKEDECTIKAKLAIFQEFEQIVQLDTVFTNTEIVASIILPSTVLKSILLELDSTCNSIIFKFTPLSFQILSSSVANDFNAYFEANGELVDEFEFTPSIDKEAREEAYQLEKFKCIWKALSISSKTALRINDQGILGLQFMVPTNDEHTIIEVYVH